MIVGLIILLFLLLLLRRKGFLWAIFIVFILLPMFFSDPRNGEHLATILEAAPLLIIGAVVLGIIGIIIKRKC
jgi:hypothetical protein